MPKRQSGHGLSVRERQVVDLAASGLTDHEIAETLGIRASTVGTYWDRIRMKFGAHTRAELVLRAFQDQSQDQIFELRRQIVALRALVERGEDFYRNALEDAADAVLIVDRSGKILHANPSAELLFGYSPRELEGTPHESLLVESDRNHHRQNMADYFVRPSAHAMGNHERVQALRKDGERLLIEASIAPVHDDGSDTAICIVRPSADPKAA